MVAPGCEPCTTTVDIAHHLLSVHVMRPSDPEFERVTYQFGYRDTDDALRLVGVTAAQPAGDDPIAHSYAISTNLVNGAKVDTLDPTQQRPGAPARAASRRVSLRPAIAFDAFAFTPQALGPELRRQPVSAFEPAGAAAGRRPPRCCARASRARRVQARSAGALRADGARDIAVVLAPPRAGAGRPTRRSRCCSAQADGSLQLGAASGPLTRDCRGCDVQVQIAHKALVVQTTANDAVGHARRRLPVHGRRPGPARCAWWACARCWRATTARATATATSTPPTSSPATSSTWSRTSRTATATASSTRARSRCGRPSRWRASRSIPAKLDAETRRDFKP